MNRTVLFATSALALAISANVALADVNIASNSSSNTNSVIQPNAGGNTVTGQQYGIYNDFVGQQINGTNNLIDLKQQSNYNKATLSQNGSTNTISLNQTGYGSNIATISELGTNHKVSLSQLGAWNTANFTLSGGDDNKVTATQDNYAWAPSTGPSAKLVMNVNIANSGSYQNVVNLAQSGYANLINTNITGGENHVDVKQTGVLGDTTNININGSKNAVALSQNYYNQKANIDIDGVEQKATIAQNTNFAIANLQLKGQGNAASVTQLASGSGYYYNTANVGVSGLGNTAKVTQQGASNVADIYINYSGATGGNMGSGYAPAGNTVSIDQTRPYNDQYGNTASVSLSHDDFDNAISITQNDGANVAKITATPGVVANTLSIDQTPSAYTKASISAQQGYNNKVAIVQGRASYYSTADVTVGGANNVVTSNQTGITGYVAGTVGGAENTVNIAQNNNYYAPYQNDEKFNVTGWRNNLDISAGGNATAADVTIAGVLNKVKLNQTGSDSIANVNKVTVNIDGTSNENTVSSSQSLYDNKTNISLTNNASGNVVTTDQKTYNYHSVQNVALKNNAYNNTVNLTQDYQNFNNQTVNMTGDSNKLTSQQSSRSWYAGNTLTANIAGNNNTFDARQIGYGNTVKLASDSLTKNNNATLVQFGNTDQAEIDFTANTVGATGNTASIVQGSDTYPVWNNIALIKMGGNDSQAAILQTGYYNTATIDTLGAGNIDKVNQTGSYNIASIIDRGVGSNATIVQSGNGNNLSVTVPAGVVSGVSNVTQTGNQKSTITVSSGQQSTSR